MLLFTPVVVFHHEATWAETCHYYCCSVFIHVTPFLFKYTGSGRPSHHSSGTRYTAAAPCFTAAAACLKLLYVSALRLGSTRRLLRILQPQSSRTYHQRRNALIQQLALNLDHGRLQNNRIASVKTLASAVSFTTDVCQEHLVPVCSGATRNTPTSVVYRSSSSSA